MPACRFRIKQKGALIKKALGADSLAYEVTDDAINIGTRIVIPIEAYKDWLIRTSNASK